jgi:group I intron endonuclease
MKGSISMYIYQITNNITNDSYIGKTSRTIQKRFNGHKYTSLKRKSQTHLHRSMRKYGIDSFTISVLEHVDKKDVLDDREKFWIKELSPKYNMTLGGDGGDTSKSPNFINSMREYHSKLKPQNYATYGMLGKKQSNKFFNSIKISNSCKVSCDGKIFSSVGEAQKAFPGISIRKRLDSTKYPTFLRLTPKIKRK